MSNGRVIIVGWELACLRAACALTKRNITPVLLEAGERADAAR